MDPDVEAVRGVVARLAARLAALEARVDLSLPPETACRIAPAPTGRVIDVDLDLTADAESR